jgi:hypothetical protein
MYVQYKPVGTTDKFEALVTTANDRVFGDMVKAQLAEDKKIKEREWRKRREIEKREARAKEGAKEKKAHADGNVRDEAAAKEDKTRQKGANVSKDVEKQKEQKQDQAQGADNAEGAVDEKGLTQGNAGVKLVEAELKDNDGAKAKDDKADHKDGTVVAVVAVPVTDVEAKAGAVLSPDEKDQQHEAEPALVAAAPPAEAKPKIAEIKLEDDNMVGAGPKGAKDIVDDAKDKDKTKKKEEIKASAKHRAAAPPGAALNRSLLVKMLGPEAANIPLAELNAALAAMEAAQALDKAKAQAAAADAPKRDEPVIWMWSESVERWRWKNYAAGCAAFEDGCWEERDWTVFADDGGCEKYEGEQEVREVEEVDLHDWSC